MSSWTKDTDNGYRAMRKVLFEKNVRVLVGITEEVGAQSHPSGYTVLEIAVWNEFGTTRIPSRPYLRGWFDNKSNKARVESWVVALMPSVINGRRTQSEVLNIVGLKIVGEIQRSIAQGVPPPNAKSTIRQKGSSTPLIDKGVLRAKLTHVVKKGADE